MLLLTRKAQQSIRIGENIIVRVIAVNGNQVKIGVQAPKDVPVHREEIAMRIAAENQRKTAP